MSSFIKKTSQLLVLVVCFTGLLLYIYLGNPRASNWISNWKIFMNNGSETTRTIEASTLLTSANWEELTRNDPILEDWTSCADSESSVIYIREEKPSYKVGDVVTVDITLKDFLRRRKRKGGDMVRLFVKDEVNGARSTGYVMDKHDGTYKGMVKLLWAGNVTIEARVFGPREFIRLIYHNLRIGRIKKPLLGLFRLDSNVIVSNCTPVDELSSHYKMACNLTQRNANLPWYCEKPQNCSCDQWRGSKYITQKISYTDQEEKLINRIRRGLKMHTKAITLRIESDTTIGNKPIDNSVPCYKLPAKLTWTAKSPVGYLYRGTWYSTQCKSTFNGSEKSFQTCLHGRKVWLIGDSNMRAMTSYFIKIMDLTLTTEKWTHKKWHKPVLASDKNINVTVFWGMHALPRYVNSGKGTHEYIDSIPAKSKDVVIVHFYVHYLPFHPSVVRKHIRKTAQSIKALKTRAPEVKVVVRGSHALFVPKEITHFNDFLGVVYDQILKEEFASLVDHVIFLDMWDLTVATDDTQNTSVHPHETIVKHAVNYMMALICNRK